MDWKLFLSTFGLIFIAELPDKTAFAILLMATRHKPVGVFLGAGAAFVVQSLVAVIFGSLLAKLPARPVHIVAGLLFLMFAVMMWREKGEKEGEEIEKADKNKSAETLWKATSYAFIVIFLAEWGDLTQLATATLAASHHAPVTIFVSATLALWAVTGFGAALGHGAKKAINPKVLQKIGAVAFALVGLVFLIRSA